MVANINSSSGSQTRPNVARAWATLLQDRGRCWICQEIKFQTRRKKKLDLPPFLSFTNWKKKHDVLAPSSIDSFLLGGFQDGVVWHDTTWNVLCTFYIVPYQLWEDKADYFLVWEVNQTIQLGFIKKIWQ